MRRALLVVVLCHYIQYIACQVNSTDTTNSPSISLSTGSTPEPTESPLSPSQSPSVSPTFSPTTSTAPSASPTHLHITSSPSSPSTVPSVSPSTGSTPELTESPVTMTPTSSPSATPTSPKTFIIRSDLDKYYSNLLLGISLGIICSLIIVFGIQYKLTQREETLFDRVVEDDV